MTNLLAMKRYREKLGNEECRRRERGYRATLKAADPLKYKATFMVGKLRWGKGAGAKMTELLKESLKKPCPYCKKTLSLEEASVDHKIPIVISRDKITPEYRKHMGRIENIHIVCRTCNQAKGNMTHEQFVKLLEFLESDADMKTKIIGRLKMANFFYKK